jgi:serpin B
MRSLLIACIGVMLMLIPVGAAGAQEDPSAPTPGQRLRAEVPPALRGTCARLRQPEMAVVVRGAIAALVCEPGGRIEDVGLYLFDDAKRLDRWWQRRRSMINQAFRLGDCKAGTSGLDAIDGLQLVCYRSKGAARIRWIDRDRLLYGSLDAEHRDIAAAFAWWDENVASAFTTDSAVPEPPAGMDLLTVVDRAAPSAPAADVESLVRGANGFALALLRDEIAASDVPNTVVGPYSISAAAALLHAGTRGRTAEEIAQVMGFDLPGEQVAAAFNALDQELASRASRRVALSNVSQLFGQTGYPFEPDYLDVAAAQFGAPVATVDFQGDAAGARKDVNEWVAASTRGAIPELVPPGAFTDQTRLAIVNASHLKAPWATPFSSDLTRDRRFHRLDGSTIRVPTMEFWQGPFAATWAEDHVAVELPYAGAELAMLVVVPQDPIGFIDALDPDVLDEVVAGLQTEFEVEGYPFYGLDLRMPRFSTRTGVALKQRLIDLGIRDAFSPEAADLTGIVDPTSSQEAGLFVSTAVHEAWVSVDEEGTEAAAATLFGADTGGGPPVDPPQVHVDRPFLWFIRDRQTEAILFAGFVSDPSQTAA